MRACAHVAHRHASYHRLHAHVPLAASRCAPIAALRRARHALVARQCIRRPQPVVRKSCASVKLHCPAPQSNCTVRTLLDLEKLSASTSAVPSYQPSLPACATSQPIESYFFAARKSLQKSRQPTCRLPILPLTLPASHKSSSPQPGSVGAYQRRQPTCNGHCSGHCSGQAATDHGSSSSNISKPRGCSIRTAREDGAVVRGGWGAAMNRAWAESALTG
jgi:hypothetical protein